MPAARPDADIATLEARREAFATVLERGVTRFLRTIPATADFEVIAVDDPYEFSTPAQFSNFRRCVRHSMPLTRAGSLDLRGARCALCRRLLGWPASESGRLCRGDRGHGRGHRRRRALMLAILYPHVLKAEVPMKRALAILGSAIFLVIAPGTLAGYGPWAICRWRMAPPFFGFFPIRMVGVLLIAAGLPVLLDSFARFAIQGLGTPAPVAPPQRLVVTGLYRYVRNPIYVAIVSLIFGQGLFFSSVGVLEYGLAVWLGFFAWVLIFEEPTLREKFGKDYEDYCARVPRWIPRLRR
jgi:protein-S-isoprenylcysteine O-methyltransferase Ste14